MFRLSVAVLAPTWEVPGEFSGAVALLNQSGYSAIVRSASAFGGAISLNVDDMAALRVLGAVPERERSTDARLLMQHSDLQRVLRWFQKQGGMRWLSDIAREVEEETVLEGEPILTVQHCRLLRFTFEKTICVTLESGELMSSPARQLPTTYLWFFYKITCPHEVLTALRNSPRVLFPSEEEIACRNAGGVVLSATLVH